MENILNYHFVLERWEIVTLIASGLIGMASSIYFTPKLLSSPGSPRESDIILNRFLLVLSIEVIAVVILTLTLGISIAIASLTGIVGGWIAAGIIVVLFFLRLESP